MCVKESFCVCMCVRECFIRYSSRFKNNFLTKNVERFRGGLVFKAHRLVYHFTLGWRVIQKKGLVHPRHISGLRTMWCAASSEMTLIRESRPGSGLVFQVLPSHLLRFSLFSWKQLTLPSLALICSRAGTCVGHYPLIARNANVSAVLGGVHHTKCSE